MLKPRSAPLSISQRQAVELAEQYLLIQDKIVLREHLTVARSPDGWHITATTTPVLPGTSTERIQFTINGDTGKITMPTTPVT